MSLNRARFFASIRPLFGKLTSAQVAGMEIILAYAETQGIARTHLAYMLATVFHETAKWMEPIREGARRYGPAYTDANSRNAIAVAVGKGLIRTNYALPEANGHSYYGRGLVQITHMVNYDKLGSAIGENLVDNPDKTLEWPSALKIMHHGMRDGLFTGRKLADCANYYDMRAVINGDSKKYGSTIAGYAEKFNTALEGYELIEETSDERSNAQGTWPPSWWPFRVN